MNFDQGDKSEKAGSVKSRQRSRAVSSESGVDFIEYSTDSSSNDLRALAQASDSQRSPKSGKKAMYGSPSSLPTGPRLSSPSPYKGKTPTGVAGQRPLNRLRAGRGRARTSSWTIDGVLKEPRPAKTRDDNLKLEMQRLLEEKQRAEERLKLIQQEQSLQQREIHAEAEKIAKSLEKN
uniref:Uncharacterized protein LOC102807410 n=1 Tax=Saccoglossus kowalevskii TaxID=10224 RepID=A0ABM0MLN0_SACKO|nr:PREDICTED: uncharacterized protein LOC102807410 [Saccoglossus kowalevskii]